MHRLDSSLPAKQVRQRPYRSWLAAGTQTGSCHRLDWDQRPQHDDSAAGRTAGTVTVGPMGSEDRRAVTGRWHYRELVMSGAGGS